MASTDTRPDPGAQGGQIDNRWPAGTRAAARSCSCSA